MKRTILFLAVMLVSGFVFAQEWEGNAALGKDGEFPSVGLYGSSNSFPQNTMVEVTNLDTGATVKVFIVSRVSNPSIFLLLSTTAAQALGVPSSGFVRVKAVQSAGTRTVTAASEEFAYHPDPDINPAAGVSDMTYIADIITRVREELSLDPAYVESPANAYTPPVASTEQVTPDTTLVTDPVATAPLATVDTGTDTTAAIVNEPVVSEPVVSDPASSLAFQDPVVPPSPEPPGVNPEIGLPSGSVDVTEAAEVAVSEPAVVIRPQTTTTAPESGLPGLTVETVPGPEIAVTEPELAPAPIPEPDSGPEVLSGSGMVMTDALAPASLAEPETPAELLPDTPASSLDSPEPVPGAVVAQSDLEEPAIPEPQTEAVSEFLTTRNPPMQLFTAPEEAVGPLTLLEQGKPVGEAEIASDLPTPDVPVDALPETPADLLPDMVIPEADSIDLGNLPVAEVPDTESVLETPEPGGLPATTETTIAEFVLEPAEMRPPVVPVPETDLVQTTVDETPVSVAETEPELPGETAPVVVTVPDTVVETEPVIDSTPVVVDTTPVVTEVPDTTPVVPEVPDTTPVPVVETTPPETVVLNEPPVESKPDNTVTKPAARLEPATDLPFSVFPVLTAGSYYLQIGVYSLPESVQRLIESIGPHYPVGVELVTTNGKKTYKVLVGPLNREESGTLLYWFRQKGYRDAFLRKG